MSERHASPLIALQVLLAVAALCVMPLWPPVSGPMLLVAIDGSDQNGLLVHARAADARILGTGLLPHSLVVVGNRATIAAQFGRWRVLMLAATAAGCRSPADPRSTS